MVGVHMDTTTGGVSACRLDFSCAAFSPFEQEVLLSARTHCFVRFCFCYSLPASTKVFAGMTHRGSTIHGGCLRGLRLLEGHRFTGHKGSSGRLAVIGGSDDYSGAPFLAAMSALRIGSDVVTVFCPPSAACAIKSYSPDVIVRGMLSETGLPHLLAALRSCHSVVIGPGMGIDVEAQKLCRTIIETLRDDAVYMHTPVVLDACAIKAICGDGGDAGPMCLRRSDQSAAPFVLTPNAHELRLLLVAASKRSVAIDIGTPASHHACPNEASNDDRARVDQALCVSQAFSATVAVKGMIDVVVDASAEHADARAQCCTSREDPSMSLWACGAPRRAAGQGDVFCGVVGSLLASRQIALARFNPQAENVPSVMDTVAAASAIVKRCAYDTFAKPGGSTYTASDLASNLGLVREALSLLSQSRVDVDQSVP